MISTTWRRKLSALALGVTVAAAVAVSTPAAAGPADQYAALAYSVSTGSYGMAWGVTEMISGKEESGWGMAAGTAIAKCKSNGANDCEGQAQWAKNAYVAVALYPTAAWPETDGSSETAAVAKVRCLRASGSMLTSASDGRQAAHTPAPMVG